jgi:hypothetical protein
MKTAQQIKNEVSALSSSQLHNRCLQLAGKAAENSQAAMVTEFLNLAVQAAVNVVATCSFEVRGDWQRRAIETARRLDLSKVS